MKLIKFTLSTIFTFSLVPLGASAQNTSSVQIYGNIGIGVNRLNHQTSSDVGLTTVTTNAISTSFWGLRGREDLGDGMAAVFRLESALAPDSGGSGNAKSFFNQQAFIGLNNANYGTLTAGRQFHSFIERAILTLDPYNLAGLNVHTTPIAVYGTNSYQGYDSRANKSIKYRYGNANGTTVSVSYAFGGIEGNTSLGSSYSFDGQYADSNFKVTGAYVHYNALSNIAGTNTTPTNSAWTVGGNFDFGSLKPYFAYYQSTITPSTATGGNDWTNKIVALGLRWQVSPQWVLRGGYYHDKGNSLDWVNGRDGTKTTTIVSTEYWLSKRTSLYAAWANNSLKDGYMQEQIYNSLLGRNPASSAVQFMSIGMNHAF